MLIAVPGEIKNTVDSQPRSEVGAQRSGPQPHGSQPGVAEKASDPSSPGVILEDILDALTVVDVPVDNEDPGIGSTQATEGLGLRPGGEEPTPARESTTWGLGAAYPTTFHPAQPPPHSHPDTPVHAVPLLGISGCYGHVVEHTKSIGSSPLAVVPRRSAGED